MQELGFFILSLLGIAALSVIFYTFWNGISPMPSSPQAIREILALIPSYLPSGTIYELGSGWGTLAIPLARRLPNQEVCGLESSWIPFAISSVLGKISSLPNLQFHCKDFFSHSLADASLVVCYLYPGAMKRLKGKFEKELKSGVWVISHTFAVPGWEPYAVRELNDIYRTRIYLYQL